MMTLEKQIDHDVYIIPVISVVQQRKLHYRKKKSCLTIEFIRILDRVLNIFEKALDKCERSYIETYSLL